MQQFIIVSLMFIAVLAAASIPLILCKMAEDQEKLYKKWDDDLKAEREETNKLMRKLKEWEGQNLS